MDHPKKIGFLSFGAWHPGGGSTHTAGDALRQTVELAVAAEQIGIDGAFVRVHHFARQLSSPFPLLTAIGVSTSRIDIGTGVIDMRYENPLYMAEEAAAADLLAGGRLQLGVSRGSPEPAWHGAEAFGYSLDGEQTREKAAQFRSAIAGAGVQRRPLIPRPDPAGRMLLAGLEGLIVNVYVDPLYRRQGLARQLLAAIIDWAPGAGIVRLVLHASPQGRPLYESLGFQAGNEMLFPPFAPPESK